jgi:hypothetical protein
MIGHFSDWTGKDEDEEDISVWEDNWDDDNVEDDFSMQLRYRYITQLCEITCSFHSYDFPFVSPHLHVVIQE